MRKSKFFKKAAVFGCVLALSAALTGCGSKDTKAEKDSGAASKEETQEAQAENIEDVQAPTDKVIDQLAGPEKGETVATLHIKDYGDIKVHFFPDAAPKAVKNFTTLAKNGYYNGITFHRVIENFMIQGGDPQGTGMGGESIWGKSFEDEINQYLIPLRGSLCMANAGGGNTNGSQFFLTQESSIVSQDKEELKQAFAQYVQQYKQQTGLPLEAYDDSVIDNYLKAGGSIYLSGGYTVFGQVYDGLDVLDKIAATKTDENDKPLEDVVIESIDVAEYEA
ncbi:peptidylprolyl isomerase [[Clostridium] polysaccharolyticum]|uniref:Peptidyl-prolyl cis-trans isomerase n=1 Tax=[Clostridium] polysaccharolyticum TaxID=29364 RepID=A0A1H9YQE6_9FIRM|nr:peptidylprolyl isomerase [[Clostridium] polysaccharolyticum]SES70873.1 peptidyl-prolyl cis-trans isomerase B (cyclophilin B) [[Clostridium] polysaccharolyticum]